MDERVRVNQKRWDVLAERHGQGADTFYDVPGFLAGGSSLLGRERAEVAAAVGRWPGSTCCARRP
ncbi:MAG TPA: hypothetical protein VHY58_16905 [Streptosporangiaceae bacterium]|jgi:hypothetical protein|nr:hypothetical protein [Streptosporangiaceae bacterium]